MLLLKEQYKIYSEKNPLKAKILLALFITLITLSIIRALLPASIKFAANSWFKSNNIESSIDEIKLSLFNGSFAIKNFTGTSKTGKSFSLDHLSVTWHWQPLLSGKIHIENFEIKGLKANSAFYNNGDLNIAGLVIKAGETELKNEQELEAEQNNSSAWDATVKRVDLSDIQFCAEQFNEQEKPALDYCATLTNFNWSGDINFTPSTHDKTSETVPLYASGSVKLKGIALNNNQLNLALLGIDAFHLKKINIDSPANINIEEIEIQQLIALQRNNEKISNDSQLVGFDRLHINPVSLSNLNNLKVGKILLEGSHAFLAINKDGHTDIAKWLPKKEKDTTQPKAEENKKEPNTKNTFNYSVDDFIFKTKKHFVFIDSSLKEKFIADIHSIDLNFKNLDSSTPDKQSEAKLSLKIDKHAELKINAKLTPLANKPSLSGNGKISGLDLRMLAPFTKQHVGHNIKSGQLDSKIKISVNKGNIESNIGLVLNHFELTVLDKKEADELNSEFGFPLNSSLSLLRDRDNSIRLDIPINGDISNPDFDPSGVIIKASSAAITSAVIQYYTPFGLIFAAGALFDLATALNFEPIIFDVNIAILNASQQQQLNKLATLMTERPGIHLTLCGFSNNEDKNKLFPVDENSKKTSEQKQVPEKPLTKEEITTLKKLAESRSSNIKKYMIDKKSIKGSRLIECSPEFKHDAISGVEISI